MDFKETCFGTLKHVWNILDHFKLKHCRLIFTLCVGGNLIIMNHSVHSLHYMNLHSLRNWSNPQMFQVSVPVDASLTEHIYPQLTSTTPPVYTVRGCFFSCAAVNFQHAAVYSNVSSTWHNMLSNFCPSGPSSQRHTNWHTQITSPHPTCPIEDLATRIQVTESSKPQMSILKLISCGLIFINTKHHNQ